MKAEDYKQKVKEIEQEAWNKKIRLSKEFALLNNPYKVGDKITDHIGTIIITSITPCRQTFSGLPICNYNGDNLTKKGTISKREPSRVVYQSNILK